MYCESCGNKLEENDKFCAYCGAPIPEGTITEAHTQEEEAPKKKKGLIIGLIALAVVLIGVGAGIFFVSRGGNPFWAEEKETELQTDKGAEDPEAEEPEVKGTEVQEPAAEDSETEDHTDDSREVQDVFEDIPGTATGIMRGTEEVYMARFSASASSMLKEANYDYRETNLSDLDPATCWADGVSGSGVNETILFVSDGKQKISGIAILPGFFKNRDLYDKNGAPSKIRVECSDEQVFTFEIGNTAWNFEGNVLENLCYFDFGEEVVTDECKVTILAVKDGNKYDDCCISELFLYK